MTITLNSLSHARKPSRDVVRRDTDNKGTRDFTCDDSHLLTVYDKKTGKTIVTTVNDIWEHGPDRYLIPLENGKWGRISHMETTDNEMVQCVKVDNESHTYQLANGVITHNTGGGKSVLQRNVVFHVIAHAKEIKFFGIDLKQVELSPYAKYSNAVLKVATDLTNAVGILNTAQEEMNRRYSEMKNKGVNNFLDLDSPGPALLVMVDEAGELLDTSAPAKALAASTFVPNLEGKGTLAELEEGDHVLGTDLCWHVITGKHEPHAQDHYKVTVRDTAHGDRVESFTTGSEHLWRVWAAPELLGTIQSHIDPVINETVAYDNDEGMVEAVVTTRTLKALRDDIPSDEWGNIRLRRDKLPTE